jgi:hypothetical protein
MFLNPVNLVTNQTGNPIAYWLLYKVRHIWPQALEFRTPLFPHLVPPAIMVWIFVWKYIFEPFIHILQHFVLQLCIYISKTAVGPRNKS